MIHQGSCHCGNIRFEVEGELNAAISCNCSICVKKGALLWAVPRQNLRLLTNTNAIERYTFNNHVIAHRFCPVCGIHPFAEDAKPSDEPSAYINIRCLDGADLESVEVQEFDGRSM
ncbi:MAG TPA: GFA family protein [Dongiaceae bacterium]